MNTDALRQWQAMQRLRTSAPSPDAFSDNTAGSTTTSGTTADSAAAPAGPLSSGTQGAATPYDSVMVNLPNGFSFGVVHLGATDQATEDQMVKSVEQMASALEGYSGVGSSDKTSANGAAPAADTAGSQGTDAPPGIVSLDMIHVDLPNGTSIEIQHAATASETSSESQAVADQMVKAADELAAALKAYSGTSSNAASNDNSSSQLPAGLTA